LVRVLLVAVALTMLGFGDGWIWWEWAYASTMIVLAFRALIFNPEDVGAVDTKSGGEDDDSRVR
jgi:hypothetical protein